MTLRDRFRAKIESLRNTFGEIVEIINEVKQDNLKEEECKDELKSLRTQLRTGFQSAREEYSQLVDEFYTSYCPFKTGNTEQDLEEYRELIGHALVAEDMGLIDKWGIREVDPKTLAKGSFQYYFDVFSDLCNNWEHFQEAHGLPEGARAYYQYLVDKLSRKIRVSAHDAS